MAASFREYAEWYDAFNSGKDYAAEAAYVAGEVREWKRDARSWLDLGCGTGGHLLPLAALGFQVEGADRSEPMLRRARLRAASLPLHLGALRNLRLTRSFDVIGMLFHVMSYQTTDEEVAEALDTVAAHLAGDGVFVFDYWHTGGVLRDPPVRRVRETRIDGRQLFRISLPDHDVRRRCVEVRFEFRWDAPDGALAHEETHSMRHFTAAELQTFLSRRAFRLVDSQGWMRSRRLSDEDWYGFAVATKV